MCGSSISQKLYIISDRPNIYSSDSEDAYDSDKEEKGAKRLMKAKKLISDDEVSDSSYKAYISSVHKESKED